MLVNSKCLNLLSRLPLLEENFFLSYSKSMFFFTTKTWDIKRVFFRYFGKCLFLFFWEFPEKYLLGFFTRSCGEAYVSTYNVNDVIKRNKTSWTTLFLQIQKMKLQSCYLRSTLNRMRASHNLVSRAFPFVSPGNEVGPPMQRFRLKKEHDHNLGKQGISLIFQVKTLIARIALWYGLDQTSPKCK